MNWPEDIVRTVWSFMSKRSALEEAFQWPRTQRIVVASDVLNVNPSAVRDAEVLYLENQSLSQVKLACKRLEMNQCYLEDVSVSKLKSLSMSRCQIQLCGPFSLQSVDLLQCKLDWPFGHVDSVMLHESSVRNLECRALHLGHSYHLSELAQWSFSKLTIEEDPLRFLDACIAQCITLPNVHFDVSNLRMFEPNAHFFRKMMWVMPRLQKLSACACNWSPAMARMLEDNLSLWPQVTRLNLNDNQAIATQNGPALVEFHARGLPLSRFEPNLQKMTVTLTQENFRAFFESRYLYLKELFLYIASVQTSQEFLECLKVWIPNMNCRIFVQTSHIQKVSFTWFAQLRFITSQCSGLVQIV